MTSSPISTDSVHSSGALIHGYHQDRARRAAAGHHLRRIGQLESLGRDGRARGIRRQLRRRQAEGASLLGLAGCTGSDVVTILQKKRVPLTRLELNVTAEEADQHPKVYTRIHVEYVFHGEGSASRTSSARSSYRRRSTAR
jgi:hypothetical protein